MISINKIIVVGILATLCLSAKAQDAAFSQYYSSMLYLNPAFSGEERNMELTANYRNQWKNVSVPYQTTQVSLIYPLYTGGTKKHHFGGLGVSLYKDNAGSGELKTLGANASLSKIVTLTPDERNVISMGAQAGVVQRKVNFDKLQWGEQYQPFLGFNSSIAPSELSGAVTDQKVFLDIAAGAVYYYNDVQEYSNGDLSGHIGVSGYHLNRPNESFTKDENSQLSRIIKLHGGIDIPVSSFFYVAPGILTLLQGEQYHINGGLRMIYNVHNASQNAFLDQIILSAGTAFRLNDSYIFSVGLGNKVFHLGFSYDMNTTGLSQYSQRVSASEISLTIKNPIDHIFNSVDTPRI